MKAFGVIDSTLAIHLVVARPGTVSRAAVRHVRKNGRYGSFSQIPLGQFSVLVLSLTGNVGICRVLDQIARLKVRRTESGMFRRYEILPPNGFHPLLAKFLIVEREGVHGNIFIAVFSFQSAVGTSDYDAAVNHVVV